MVDNFISIVFRRKNRNSIF